MMTSVIEINGCNHYPLNEQGQQIRYFIHSSFLVEKDYQLNHPLGSVYKPKGCIDTLIRFVKQPNNSTLMFRVNDWNVPNNPYYVAKTRLGLKDIIEAFYSSDV
jgi:hypothetical protein